MADASTEALYHLVPLPEWEAQRAGGAAEWRPASLTEQGFVHLSFARQVAGTLELFFAGVDAVVLLELAPAQVGGEVRLEPAPSGELFPHLYAPLPMAAIVAERTLRRGSAGFDVGPLA